MANITLKKEDEKVTNLVIKPMHSNGVYKVHVRKEVVERNFSTWMPFENGNFNVTIGQGRKSQKKLDTLNQIIEDNKETLNSLWLEDKFQDMCQLVHEQAVLKKVA